jgi:RNA-splicing ligase RtcB
MKYENPEKISIEKINSENENDRILALLNLVMNGNDYEKAMESSLEFAKENSEWIKGCGIECFGHIARIYKKLDLEAVKEILKESLKSESKIVAGKAEEAVEDISLFMKLAKQTWE